MKKDSFQCTQCGLCCKNLKPYSVIFFPEDLINMSKALGITSEKFIKDYCEYKDLLLDDTKLHVCYLKTNHTDCPFLKGKLCSVHQNKPIQCRRAPYGFFSYYEIWKYMPCVCEETYPEGSSYEDDCFLMKQYF